MNHISSWNIPSVRDIDLKEKRVFCRFDFNVPLKDGKILDDYRIRRALPTIHYLIKEGAKIIIATHLGYPKGKIVEDLRTEQIAIHLSNLLGRPVLACRESVGYVVEQAISNLQAGDLIMLENVRFLPEEEQNNVDLALKWSRMADVYVNDAFATSHRSHTSVSSLANCLPAVGGLLLESELTTLKTLFKSPQSPFISVIGGSKVFTKIDVIKSLLKVSDTLIVGGMVANTFLVSKGYSMDITSYEPKKVETAKQILELVNNIGKEILLPVDLKVEDCSTKEITTKSINNLTPSDKPLDVGPMTSSLIRSAITQSKQILWNGPMGKYEDAEYTAGTRDLMTAMANSSALTVCGGGDTLAAIRYFQFDSFMNYLSTGGGALLESLKGIDLPGILPLLTSKDV
ncbi:phosphoglycerate kinase [Paenibacillus taichungensis]|uniref:phosphoglycerate kinase n=1 Tax=Paenibacillus taichungensis TaxID=484184 RepID=UPI00287208EF|nr:phosphoglycerate kinase [Paenibacillus taichungensis]MDR9748554.1 phosphoglycerate kinase [Paenibacillus taichungensis]